MSNPDSEAALRAEYRDLVIERDAAKANAPEAKRIFDGLHQCYKRLPPDQLIVTVDVARCRPFRRCAAS